MDNEHGESPGPSPRASLLVRPTTPAGVLAGPPQLPRGVHLQAGAEWQRHIAGWSTKECLWSCFTSSGAIFLFVTVLMIVLMRPLPSGDRPAIADSDLLGHSALANFVTMPEQYNLSKRWGSYESLPPSEGHPLNVAFLVAHGDQEYPSLYSGAPAEPRLSEEGMRGAFLLGSSIRKGLLLQGLLLDTPSAPEAAAVSLADARAIDTANAFLLGLLPIGVNEMWQQHQDQAECWCRDEPREIRFSTSKPSLGWGTEADVLSARSATSVQCLARCMGVSLLHKAQERLPDRQLQPVPIQTVDPSHDVLLRQFDVCKRGKHRIAGAVKSQEWVTADRHKFSHTMEKLRSLKIVELCVAALGTKNCRGSKLLDIPTTHDVVKAHLVHEEIWQKSSLDRQSFAYDLFVAAEWVQRRMFPSDSGSSLGGILLGDILQHWHEQLVATDKRYRQTVVDWGAFTQGDRDFQRWSEVLLEQEYQSKANISQTRFHLYSGHRWQVLALLAALGPLEPLPLPEDLSHVTLTLRSTQGTPAYLKARGIDANSLLVEMEYCVDSTQCGRLRNRVCPVGICSWQELLEKALVGGRAVRNPNASTKAGAWSQDLNLEGCTVWPRPKSEAKARKKHGRRQRA